MDFGSAGNTNTSSGAFSSEMITLSRCHAAPAPALSCPMLIDVSAPSSGISRKNVSHLFLSKLSRDVSSFRFPLDPFVPNISMCTVASVPA